MNWMSFCALILSALTSIVAITTVIVQMRSNVTRLQEQGKNQNDREERAAREVTELIVLLKTFIAEQTQINKTVELGLGSTIRKLEEMDKRTVETSTVVRLLTEVLKKTEGRGLSIEP